MLKFISFGSGSSGNCYYIFTDTHGILIDIGISMRKLQKYFNDYGLSLKDVNAILVTHDHADHVKSVGNASINYNLPVYATKETHEGIRRNYCVRKKVADENKRIITKNEPIRFGSMEITPFHVPHDSMDNIGFKICEDDTVFCLMTDIGHVTDEMAGFIGEADYLVIEANHDEEMLKNGPYPEHLKLRVAGDNGHLSNRKCAESIYRHASGKLKHVWLCHLSQENNHPELARIAIEQALEKAPQINRQVKLDILKRTMPSEIYTLKEQK